MTLAAAVAAVLWHRAPDARLTRVPDPAPKGPAIRDDKAPVTLRLLGDDFVAYETFRTEVFLNALRNSEPSVTLEWKHYGSYEDAAKKLNTGAADLLLAPLNAILRSLPRGQIIVLIDYTVGSDALVLNNKADRGLTSLAALAARARAVRKRSNGRKRLALSYVSEGPSDFFAMLLHDSRRDGFDKSLFEMRALPRIKDVLAALTKKKGADAVAGAFLWEPFISRARNMGYAVAASTCEYPEQIIDVLFASERTLKRYPAALAALVEEYYLRIEQFATDPNGLVTTMSRRMKLKDEDARSAVAGVHYFDAITAARWFKGDLQRRIGITARILRQCGQLSRGAVTRDWVRPEFVQKVAKNAAEMLEDLSKSHPDRAAMLKRGVCVTDNNCLPEFCRK